MRPTGGGARRYTEDVRIATREQERLQVQLFHPMGKHSCHHWKEIEEHVIRDRYMSARRARAFGLVDQILGDVSDVVKMNELYWTLRSWMKYSKKMQTVSTEIVSASDNHHLSFSNKWWDVFKFKGFNFRRDSWSKIVNFVSSNNGRQPSEFKLCAAPP